MTRRTQWGLGLLLVLAATSTALALSTYTWEFTEPAASFSRSSPSHVDLYNAGGASHARLINNAYAHTQNTQPGNPLVLATPAPVQTATLTTVSTTATEGFSPTGLTDLTWMGDHLETTPPDELPVSTSGLTALYHFNEATGTTALDVKRNRNAAISGTYSWLVPGQLGQSALQFVSAAVTDGVAPQTGPASIVNWTLEAWVKIDPAGITNANGAMVLYLGTQWFSGSGYGMWISPSEQLGVSYGGVGCIIGCGSAGTVPVNAWVHLAITRDSGGFARGYINGVESTTDIDANITPIQPLGTITIGAAPGGGFGLNFPGAIDEVAVYNRVVPAAEILAHSMRKLKGTYLSNTFDASRTQTTNPPVSTTNPLVQVWRSLAWTETPADIGEEPAASTSGLQALWRLEDLGGTVSNSVPTGPGGSLGASTVAGADDPKWLPGKLGSGGLWFDGGDFVAISDSSVLAPSTNRTTVEAWVRPDVQGAATLYSRRTGGDVGGMALELGASGQLIFKVHSGSAWQPATTAADMVASGVWSHVAGTYDGSAVKAYVNGVERASTAYAGIVNNPGGAQVRMGVNSATGGSFLRGALDSVAMYNRALSATELQDHYTQGATSLLFKVQTSADNSTWAPLAPSSQLAAQTPGLQILWRFDEGAGRATTADTTGGTNVTADPAQLGLDQLPAGDGSDPSWELAASAKYGNSALRFDGASDFVTTTAASPGLQSFTIELWFKAAAGVSGTLVGFGGNLLPVSALRDRLVYLDNAGKVVFGVAPGGVKKTVSSTGSYLNSQWHHVAAVLGPAGMALFVDGILQGQDATATGAQAMTGYWHLGYEDLTTWPNAPGNHRFGGTLDEVAIYDVPLDAATIARRVEESFQGLSTAAGSALNASLVPNGRYLRVKAYLATENKAITPTLSALTASANNFPLRVGTYPQDWPYVSNYVAANPLAPDFTILGPSAFNVTLAPGSAATILYQLSRDGTNWYCYSGGLWRLVNPPPAGGACGNLYYAPLGNIQAGFESFATTVGPGKLYWRAFYLSNGDQDTRLDRITAEYESASFTVTAPALNETWLTERTHTITWNHTGTIVNVKIEYSPKGDFSDTEVVAASATNSGSFVWNMPLGTTMSDPSSNPGAGTSKIRVSGADAGTSHIKDDSDNFTVTELDVTIPANETWLLGETRTVTWSSSASAGQNVRIDYAPDGANYTKTLAASEPNDGSFDWVIPMDDTFASTPTADPGLGGSRVRVAFAAAPTLFDVSPSMTLTRLQVTAPTTGDLWRLGKQHTIAWTTTALGMTNVQIDYSATGDFGGAVTTIAASASSGGASGSFPWALPVDVNLISATDTATIRVTGVGAFSPLQAVSAGFTVTRPFIQILTPTAGQVVAVQSVQAVSWDKEGQISDTLRFEYSTNGFADESQTVCFLNCGGSGFQTVLSPYSWVVPQAAASPTVKLRLSDLNIPDGFGISDAFKVAGGLNVAAPVAGSLWAVGKPHTIQWTSVGNITAVRLELSNTGPGGPFTEIDAATPKPNGPGGGSYVWTPAVGDASATAVIRVFDAADADVKADSALFVVSNLVIGSPAGSERWLAGSQHDVTWSSIGVANVLARFSLDTGGSWTPIGSAAASAGLIAWTLPMPAANGTVRVQLQDADAPAGEARAETLSNPLTIYGQLSLAAPVGGESWSSGQPHDVTWTTPVGTIPAVTVDYSLDNFICNPAANCGVIAASAPNTGVYSWTPSFTSTTVKIRVSDAQDAQAESRSPDFFEVTGIAIQQPAGGEVWTVGSTNKLIRWNFTGSFTKVKLEYSTDGFVSASLIEDNVLNTGTYTWATVPDAISSNVTIRVTPVEDPSLYSTSNPLTIQGILQLTAPNGGDVLDVGSSQNIQWNATGSMPTITLRLSTNGGTGFPIDLATVTGALGGGTTPVANTYALTVPDAISSQARVRVSDAVPGHPASADDSNANFTIRAALGVVSPGTGEVWAVNEVHPIQWTTRGTVSQVIFEHAVDGGPFTPFGVANNCAPPDGVTPCLMNWTVPNLVPSPQSDPDVSVVIRVKDATPAHPAASADAAALTVKWYKVIWHVLDSENNNHLGGLTVQDVLDAGDSGDDWMDSNLSSSAANTLFHYYPFGTFNTTWSKDGYFSGSASGWAADADKTVTVYLESETADQVEFHVHAESAYDPGTDTLSFKTWLEKRGLLVGTTAADLSRLGGSTIEVYDGTTLLRTLSDAAADTKGQYEFTWPATGLTGGKVYFATASVIYPNQPAPGVTRTSGGVVNVTIPKQIDSIQSSSGGGVTLTELQTELQPIETAVATTIPDAITASQTAVEGTVTSTVGAAQGQLQSDITASQAAIQTDIATSQTAVQSTVTTAQTAIQSDVAGVQTTADAVKTDTGQIKSDVQMVLIPQAAAIKNETSLIKADTAAIQNDTTNIQADTAAMRPLTQDTNTKVSAILSDPNVGLPMVQQMLTDQGTMIQDQFKTTRRGAILNRDGSVEKGEIPAITYRSEGGVPTLDVFNALNGTRVLGPALMQFNAATGLYDFAIDTTALADGEYKVMVNEPSSATSDGTIDSFTMTVREPALRDASAGSSVTQALAELDTKVSTALNQLDGLAATADAIQSTTNTTKTVTDQLATDVQKISQGWGTQSLEQVSEQLSALSTKVGAPAQSADTSSLVSQVARLQELVQSAQGSAVSVSYSQNAMSAALEAVELLKQLHSQLASGLPTAPPAQLEQLEAALSRLGQAVAVIPGDVAAGDMGKQVAQLAEQVKVLASEKGYAFDALYEMSESQTTDVKMVRNRVEELKALLDVQQSIMENRLNEPVVKTWFESNY